MICLDVCPHCARLELEPGLGEAGGESGLCLLSSPKWRPYMLCSRLRELRTSASLVCFGYRAVCGLASDLLSFFEQSLDAILILQGSSQVRDPKDQIAGLGSKLRRF